LAARQTRLAYVVYGFDASNFQDQVLVFGENKNFLNKNTTHFWVTFKKFQQQSVHPFFKKFQQQPVHPFFKGMKSGRCSRSIIKLATSITKKGTKDEGNSANFKNPLGSRYSTDQLHKENNKNRSGKCLHFNRFIVFWRASIFGIRLFKFICSKNCRKIRNLIQFHI
jgi:hypothetical protein